MGQRIAAIAVNSFFGVLFFLWDLAKMFRPLRFEYPDAFYNILNRGLIDQRKLFFRDKGEEPGAEWVRPVD
jgi:hypothetical protein